MLTGPDFTGRSSSDASCGVLRVDVYTGFNELYRVAKAAASQKYMRYKIHDVHVPATSETTRKTLHRMDERYVIEPAIRSKSVTERNVQVNSYFHNYFSR